jgi:alpha-L-fucosidase
VGCREKDNLRLPAIGPKWQNPATLGTSYGYLKAEDEADAYKSPAELIHLLCDVVSKNGNLLLNLGPRADGTIPEGMRRRLLAIGAWLQINGAAIYLTRPWSQFGEGPDGTEPSGKPVRVPGANLPDARAAHDIRFTRSADNRVLYALVLGPAKSGESVTIHALAEGVAGASRPISKVEMLGVEAPIQWSRNATGLTIVYPHQLPPPAGLGVAFALQ